MLSFQVSFKHNENEITFAIKLLIYSSSMGNRLFCLPGIIRKTLDYLPQSYRFVVDDVSVVVEWKRFVEHIESFVVKLMPGR